MVAFAEAVGVGSGSLAALKARLGEKTPQEALDFVTEQAQKELDTWLAQQG